MDYERLESGISGVSAALEQPQHYSRARRAPESAKRYENDREAFGSGPRNVISAPLGQGATRMNIPLLEVSADVNVVESVASTVLTQVFTNPTNDIIRKATYIFPLYEGATVVSFCAWIGPDTVIKGVVKPKGKAHQEYDKATASQKVATLLDEHTPEIFEARLGNIPPAAPVRIDITYINQLKPDVAGKGLLLTIPTSIAPRYGIAPPWMPQHGPKMSMSTARRGMKIRVEVSTSSPISQLNSLSHIMDTKIGFAANTSSVEDLDDTLSNQSTSSGQDRTKGRATLSRSTPLLDKDIVLLVSVEDDSLLAPKALMEHSLDRPNNSAMILSFTPSDLFTPKLPKKSLGGEIIFVVDRSGSMYDKVGVLRHSLQTFLANLPKDNCIFNICSFGSTSELLWPSSVRCSEKNFERAQEFLRTTCEADMGGTELKSALQKSVESRKIRGKWSTQIMVLTDGEVWDYSRTIDYIHQTRKKHEQKVRFFGLGIGDEVSHQLIEDIGRFGGGFSEIVPSDLPDLREDRIKRMLDGALTPNTWDCNIKLKSAKPGPGDKEDDATSETPFIQAPIRLPPLHALSTSTVYFLFDMGEPIYDTVIVSGTSSDDVKAEISLPITHVEVPTPRIHYLAAKSILKELENGKHPQGPAKAREECERLGVEWSIIGKWTSFVGVDQANGTENMSRLYKAHRVELDALTKPRHIDPFSLFRGHKFLPWNDSQFSPYDDNDDDDDNDDKPDSSGEGTSSKRTTPRFCGSMRLTGTSRRRHDDDDDGGSEDWYGGGHNGFNGMSRNGNGASTSTISSSSRSSNQDTGTSVQWITKSAFASLHDEPWSSNYGICPNSMGWHDFSMPKYTISERLLDFQIPSGAFFLEGVDHLQAKELLLDSFRPSVIDEINGFLRYKDTNDTAIAPVSARTTDLQRQGRTGHAQVLHTSLAVAYLTNTRHGYGKGRSEDIAASIARARGWLQSIVPDAHLLEEFANNGLERKLRLADPGQVQSCAGCLSNQSQMVFFRRRSGSLHLSQPWHGIDSAGTKIVSQRSSHQGTVVALDASEGCRPKTLDTSDDNDLDRADCFEREE